MQLFDVAEATVVIVLASPALLLSAQPISRIIMPLTGCYGWPAALHTHSHTHRRDAPFFFFFFASTTVKCFKSTILFEVNLFLDAGRALMMDTQHMRRYVTRGLTALGLS